jgi:hypothetical protein
MNQCQIQYKAITYYCITACLDIDLIAKQKTKKQPADGFFHYTIRRRFEFKQIDTTTWLHG